MKLSAWLGSALIVPTNLLHLVPDHAQHPSNPDPAHALRKKTDHVAHPQMTQVHEDDHEDDGHTPSARAGVAAAPTQTHRPSQHARPDARSAADAQKAGASLGPRRKPDAMSMI